MIAVRSAGIVCLAVAVAVALGACSAMPGRQQSVVDYVSQQKSAARQAQEQQQLAQALTLWRTLLPLDANDAEVNSAILDLNTQIDSQSRELLRRGKSAYARGKHREGDAWMLKVLVLQPGQEQALAGLRKSASARAQAQQATKSEEEIQVKIAGKKTSPDSLEPAPLLDRSVGLRKQLSDEWYSRGNALLQKDLPGAIAALEKSLGYNPQNRVAALKLKQARMLQRNLQKIQGKTPGGD